MRQITERTSLNTSFNPIATKIISDTPGRLRLRIAPGNRQAEKIQHIANFLTAQPHITQVRTNIHHGSILINHDGHTGTVEEISATLRDIGIIFAAIFQGKSEAATSISNVVIDLNQRVERATDSAVDLRFLFPCGLSILAMRQLIVKGLQLEVIPWYVLAWYAFDSFLKLNNVVAGHR